MKKTVVLLAVLAMAVSANAVVAPITATVTYGWEDGGVVLGTYADQGSTITVSNSSEYAYTGSASLKIVEDVADSTGTPQAFVGWITGLNEGDTVTASFWVYDTTTSSSPSGRIWGSYSTDSDINDYEGAAGGNNAYSGASTWTQLSHTWTVAYGKEALVIQARIYGSASTDDFIYVDDISITAPDHATIVTPVPEPATMLLLGLGSLVLAHRRK